MTVLAPLFGFLGPDEAPSPVQHRCAGHGSGMGGYDFHINVVAAAVVVYKVDVGPTLV